MWKDTDTLKRKGGIRAQMLCKRQWKRQVTAVVYYFLWHVHPKRHPQKPLHQNSFHQNDNNIFCFYQLNKQREAKVSSGEMSKNNCRVYCICFLLFGIPSNLGHRLKTGDISKHVIIIIANTWKSKGHREQLGCLQLCMAEKWRKNMRNGQRRKLAAGKLEKVESKVRDKETKRKLRQEMKWPAVRCVRGWEESRTEMALKSREVESSVINWTVVRKHGEKKYLKSLCKNVLF